MPNIGRPRAEVVVTDEERAALVRLTSPKALIYRTAADTYRMKFDGVDGDIAVTRLR